MTDRLDNFTDAAFAFAVTLLVIGGSEAPTSYAAPASMLLAAFEATETIAPSAYAALPVTIGLLTWRYDREGAKAAK